MPALVCTAMIGLFCLTSPEGELKAPPPLFFEEKTYTVGSRYKVYYLRSDLHSPYDVKNYKRICGEADCLWVRVGPGKCSLTFVFVLPSQGAKGLVNTSYTISSGTEAGLRQGLSETYLRYREGRGDLLRPLETVVGPTLPECPSQ